MLDLIITNAFAQETVAAAAKQPSFLASIAPLVIIFAIFYFLVLRPQSKKMQEQQQMVTALTKGNKVMTNSGIYGTIKKVDQDSDTFELEIAKDVVIKINRNAVSELQENIVTKAQAKNA